MKMSMCMSTANEHGYEDEYAYQYSIATIQAPILWPFTAQSCQMCLKNIAQHYCHVLLRSMYMPLGLISAGSLRTSMPTKQSYCRKQSIKTVCEPGFQIVWDACSLTCSWFSAC